MGVQRSVPFFAMQPSHTALGTWSGGRFMHFGEPLDDERLEALLRPGDGIDTVITADAYGAGEADSLLGRALAGVPTASYSLVGAVGHDFYEGEREGPKGYPRFTDPELRGAGRVRGLPADGDGALARAHRRRLRSTCSCSTTPTARATEPGGVGGDGGAAPGGAHHALGVAPGPANGFTLDVIDCLERFGEIIDWAMVILNPMEPWPGELVLPAARRARREGDLPRRRLRRAVLGRRPARPCLRGVRPPAVPARRLDRVGSRAPGADAPDRGAPRPDAVAARVRVGPRAASRSSACAPTLIQEPASPKSIEAKRAELAAVPDEVVLSAEEVEELRAIGDNTGSMVLKGASPDHDGPAEPDRWPLDDQLEELAARWAIDPARDLVKSA